MKVYPQTRNDSPDQKPIMKNLEAEVKDWLLKKLSMKKEDSDGKPSVIEIDDVEAPKCDDVKPDKIDDVKYQKNDDDLKADKANGLKVPKVIPNSLEIEILKRALKRLQNNRKKKTKSVNKSAVGLQKQLLMLLNPHDGVVAEKIKNFMQIIIFRSAPIYQRKQLVLPSQNELLRNNVMILFHIFENLPTELTLMGVPATIQEQRFEFEQLNIGQLETWIRDNFTYYEFIYEVFRNNVNRRNLQDQAALIISSIEDIFNIIRNFTNQ